MEYNDDTMWWCIKAGRGGIFEDDWLEQDIITVGWGDKMGNPGEYDPEPFQEEDPSHNNQLSKFIGYGDGMTEDDIAIVYAPGKGHISGVGQVGPLEYVPDPSFQYIDPEDHDHYYHRSMSWFDWETPVLVNDLPQRFHVHGGDQIPTPMTLHQFGTRGENTDRIDTFEQSVKEAETVEDTTDRFGPEAEAQIQEWLFSNISQLGCDNPRREVSTSAGDIDILADDEQGEAHDATGSV